MKKMNKSQKYSFRGHPGVKSENLRQKTFFKSFIYANKTPDK